MAQTTTSSLALDTTAYNLRAWMALRPTLFYDDLASVKTTPQTHKGSSVVFPLFADLAAATTPLTETSDVTPVAMSDSQVTVTLAEYGNVTETTAKVTHTSYIEFDPVAADAIGYNAGISMDTVVGNVLAAGTNVLYAGTDTARNTLSATDKITSSKARLAYARLTANNVRPFDDGYYRAIIHPDVAYDLKEETGDIGWRVVHNNSLPGDIVNGDIGAYEGFRWTVSPRATIFADASSGAGGSGAIDVYSTLFMGQEALAKAYSSGTHGDGQQLGPDPLIIKGPFTDNLYRFRKLGWYQFAGYGIFRQAALWRLETASTIGTNT
jgi:N4-gp56 family major capsid protein